MDDRSAKEARECCSQAHERLLEQLDACDSRYSDKTHHHRCYRIAARTAGRQAKACLSGG
jgi:hypothetical protein